MFKYGHHKIEVVSDYIYLGVQINYDIHFEKAMKKQLDQGRKAQFLMLVKARNLDLPIDIQCKLFEVVQVMAYADDITITSTHTSTSAAKKYIQPYQHKVFAWTKQNNLLLNPDKTTCTLFTPDPAEYTSNLDLTINNKALPMATHPKVLGLTLDPKLTYSTHIHNISVLAHKPLHIIKALTVTGFGKQKETLMATYKAVMRPALEYASSVWSSIASSTSINKLQVMQNAALRTATGCTQDTNIQHLHDETFTLPIHEHLQLHASQYKQKTQHPSHPLHKHTTYFNTPRLKTTLFLTTAATQQTFPQTPTQSLQQT